MLVTLLASPIGVHTVAYAFPRVTIVTTAIDETLDQHFHIRPGFGACITPHPTCPHMCQATLATGTSARREGSCLWWPHGKVGIEKDCNVAIFALVDAVAVMEHQGLLQDDDVYGPSCFSFALLEQGVCRCGTCVVT